MKIDKDTQDKLLRLLLRWVPIVPAPEIYDLLRNVQKSQDDVEQQVAEAITAIENTSNLVTQLEASLKDRAQKLETLQQEHARYAELTKIELEKAKPLLAQVERSLGKNAGKERVIAFGINIAAGMLIFILGIVLSEPLQSLWEGNKTPPAANAEQDGTEQPATRSKLKLDGGDKPQP